MAEAHAAAAAAVVNDSRPQSRKPLSSPQPAWDQGLLEIVSQTADDEVDLDVVYDALAALLIQYYRRGHSP